MRKFGIILYSWVFLKTKSIEVASFCPLPVMGAISTVIMIALLVYIYFAFLRKKKQTNEKTAENPPENANKNE